MSFDGNPKSVLVSVINRSQIAAAHVSFGFAADDSRSTKA